MNSKALICEFTGCKLILENPVTMPCGNSICKHHLVGESDENYNCFFCQQQHEIPKNGFAINKAFDLMIQNYLDFNPIRKKIIKSFERVSESVNEYNTFDPNLYIYDYFADIRNKVDLNREELFKEINERSDEIIRQLKEKENKCKLYVNKLAKININLDKLGLLKREIRKEDVNEIELNQLLNELNCNREEILRQIIQIKNRLLLGEKITYKKIQKRSFFGHLITQMI